MFFSVTTIEVRKGLKWHAATILFLFILLLALVAPVDYTPLENQPFYSRMMNKLDTFQLETYPASQPTKVGWSQFSIVPDHPVAMAGYRPREKFIDVHDSLYARILTIDNGSTTVYFISVDLLLFPPALKELLIKKAKLTASDFMYFSATHTHTGVGGWDPTTLGEFLMGDYQETWMNQLADNIIHHMQKAKDTMRPATILSWEANGLKYVVHRIDKTGKSLVDGKLRGVSVIREDSTKALLFTFGVHPTLISRKGTSLSADYPGVVISELHTEYQYSQFLAGMMGSHGVAGLPIYEFPFVDLVGKSLAKNILGAEQIPEGNQLLIKTGHIKIEHGPSQLRLTKNLKLRNWVFEWLTGPLTGEIDVVKIGDILFLGVSCDFSGEIFKDGNFEAKASAVNSKLIITSFNGEYTGYITADAHYSKSAHEEVRALNWVGPYFGKYYSEIIEQIIGKSSQ